MQFFSLSGVEALRVTSVKSNLFMNLKSFLLDKISYLHSHYARSLKHRLNRHDTGYVQLPAAEQPLTLSTTGAPLSPLTTCATVSTSVGHAITGRNNMDCNLQSNAARLPAAEKSICTLTNYIFIRRPSIIFCHHSGPNSKITNFFSGW